MDPQSPLIPPGLLAEVSINHDFDLVTLRQRTRAAGDQLGLETRDVRSLSAATYEAAQVVFAQTGRARGEVRLIEGPALQVTIATEAANGDVGALRERLTAALHPLRALVHRFAVEEEGRTVTVKLTVPSRHGISARLSLTASEVPSPPRSHATEQDLLQEILLLHRTQQELQAELQETNRGVIAMFTELETQAEQLRQANRAKEQFLATLSHELRTPLNAILGWTRLLRIGKLDAAGMKRALETIERNAQLQEQLIADILDVSRIVTGKLRLVLRPIELPPILEAAADAVRPAAEAKGVRLVVEIQDSGSVMGDPDRLQQVIWNLLANAIKFTPPGGEIRLWLECIGASEVVTVADTGEGIMPDLLPYIFDRFTQGDGSVTRPHGGLGLGLSIVRHIVELHGGQVQARSDGPGRGATFTVALPLRTAHSTSAPESGIGSVTP